MGKSYTRKKKKKKRKKEGKKKRKKERKKERKGRAILSNIVVIHVAEVE